MTMNTVSYALLSILTISSHPTMKPSCLFNPSPRHRLIFPLTACMALLFTLAAPATAAPEIKEVVAPDRSSAYFGRDNIEVEVVYGPSESDGPLIEFNTFRRENVTLVLTDAQNPELNGTEFTSIFANTEGEGNNIRVRYTFGVPNLELLSAKWAGTYTLSMNPDEVGEMTNDGSPPIVPIAETRIGPEAVEISTFNTVGQAFTLWKADRPDATEWMKVPQSDEPEEDSALRTLIDPEQGDGHAFYRVNASLEQDTPAR